MVSPWFTNTQMKIHKHTDKNVNTRTLGQKCVNPNTLVKARLGLSVVHKHIDENVNTRTLGQKCVNPLEHTRIKARRGLSVVHLLR